MRPIDDDEERYRRQAADARRQAERARTEADRLAWLRLAQAWLGLVQTRAQMAGNGPAAATADFIEPRRDSHSAAALLVSNRH